MLCKHQLEPETCAMCLREAALRPRGPSPRPAASTRDTNRVRKGVRRPTLPRRFR